MSKIFSTVTAKRLFREESFDLAIVAPSIIQAAAEEFEAEGDYGAATDIQARFEDYQEELRIMEADARREFGNAV